MSYYIISLKHTFKEDKYITLWRPNNAGYCYAKDQAGMYDEIIEGYHNMKCDSMPVKCEELSGLFINSEISSKNQVKKCIPNCEAVWDYLKVKMTKNGLAPF